MRFYVYVSRTKVELLYDQIPEGALSRIAAKRPGRPCGQLGGDEHDDQGADHGGANAGADLLRGVVECGADGRALLGIASASATAQIVMTMRRPIVIRTIEVAMAG